MDSDPIQRTANAPGPSVENMGITHRRFDVAMAQEFLNRSKRHSKGSGVFVCAALKDGLGYLLDIDHARKILQISIAGNDLSFLVP